MNLSKEDNDLREILTRYLTKLENGTLSVFEKMNLIDFYLHDVKEEEPPLEEYSDDQLMQFVTLGWIISSMISGN